LTTTTDIADVYVLLGAKTGGTPTYDITAASGPTPAKVTITTNSASEVSYLILVSA
jgi:hypothetical protein